MKISIIALLVAVVLLLPAPIAAQLAVNEVYPNPSYPNDESEWLELINLGEEVENLEEWLIDSAPLSQQQILLPPGSIWVVTRKLSAFVQEFGAITNIVDLTSLRLTNSGDSIVLTGPSGESVEFEYGATSSGGSHQLKVGECQEVAFVEESSPGEPNSVECFVEQQIDQNLTKLLITEFMANPEGIDAESEWVELHNPTTSLIQLAGLQITDSSGVIAEFGEGDTIGADKYLQVLLSGSPLKNCSSSDCEEQISLVAEGREFLSVSYSDTESGQSISLFDGEWKTAGMLVTPGKENARVPQVVVQEVVVRQQGNLESMAVANLGEAAASPPPEGTVGKAQDSLVQKEFKLPIVSGAPDLQAVTIERIEISLVFIFVVVLTGVLCAVAIDFRLSEKLWRFIGSLVGRLRSLAQV